MKDRFSTWSDLELVSRIKNGDRAAFATVYEDYSEVLYRFLLRRLTSRDDARDVLHDVFERIWVQRKSLSDDTAIFPYLFRAVQNRSLDLIRRQITRQKYVASFQRYVASRDEDEMELEAKDILAVIRKELESFPVNTQRVMEMRILDGFTNKEISALLGLSEDSVKSHVKRGIKLLRSRKKHWTLLFLLS